MPAIENAGSIAHDGNRAGSSNTMVYDTQSVTSLASRQALSLGGLPPEFLLPGRTGLRIDHLPSNVPGADDLPLAIGYLMRKILGWVPDMDDLGFEVISTVLYVPKCPRCDSWHRHCWPLTGEPRIEWRASHCHKGIILIRPALAGEELYEKHWFSPTVRRSRPRRMSA